MLKKISFIFLSLLTIFSLYAISCEDHGISLDKNRLNDIVNRYVADDYYPFLYVQMQDKDGRLMYEHSAVNNEIHPGLEVDGKTLIRIWSMSKIVTISVAMDLIEDGILHLNEPVTKYIPEFKYLMVAQSKDGRTLSTFGGGSAFGEPIDSRIELACPLELVKNDSTMLVRHLMDHTAGFYYANTKIECLDDPIIDEDPVMAQNSDSLINILSRLPLIHHPGERSHYGLSTTVLGLVAERATGITLDQLVSQRITEPLGFSGMRFKLEKGDRLIPPMTYKNEYFRIPKKGEMDILGKNVPKYDKEQKLYFGGEGLVSTSEAYAKYLEIWLNDGILNDYRFLDERTIDQMLTSVRKKSGYGIDTKYFFFITGDSVLAQGTGDVGLWDGGGYEGTTFWVDKKRGFSVIVMTQLWEPKDGAYNFRDEFRAELYNQIFAFESR